MTAGQNGEAGHGNGEEQEAGHDASHAVAEGGKEGAGNGGKGIEQLPSDMAEDGVGGGGNDLPLEGEIVGVVELGKRRARMTVGAAPQSPEQERDQGGGGEKRGVIPAAQA